MSTRRDFPLLLLLLTWTFPTRIHCQNVTVSLVSTEYVELTWIKQLQWFGVDEYHVKFTPTGFSDCHETVQCSTETCTFNSVLCGVLFPCTPTTVTISGGNYTAPAVSQVTGPEKVTNMTLSLKEGVEHISWVNPSMDSSPCYENTAVRVSFNGKDSINYFSLDTENTSKPLCIEGHGEVEVWTQGGDGYSNSSWGTIVYNGSSLVDLVTFETCESVGCTGIEVKWSYVPVCPDVAYILITMDDVKQNVSINATNLTVMGLEVDDDYVTCIEAMSIEGKVLDSSCQYYCKTAYQVPENLAVEPLSSTSLRATWDPPVCQKDPTEYVLKIDYEEYTTTATKYNVENLRTFTVYEVQLQVGHSYQSDEHVISTTASTLPTTPSLYIGTVLQDYVHVWWYGHVSSSWDYDFYYKVTWGTSQQYEKETKEEEFTITGYSTDEVFKVCVASVPQGREDLTSHFSCEYVPDPGTEVKSRGWEIALGVTMLVVVVVVTLIITYGVCNKSKAQNRQQQLQQQQQQQQQQELQQGNYGIDNLGANN